MKTYDLCEAAKFLKTSETTLSSLIMQGEIPAAKIGQCWHIREDDLDAYSRRQVDLQTAERLEAIARGEKPKVKTAFGRTRNQKPNLDDLDIAA